MIVSHPSPQFSPQRDAMSIERWALFFRYAALFLLAVAVLVLSACVPVDESMAPSSAASSLRRVGVTHATSNRINCNLTDTTTTAGGVTVERHSCEQSVTTCCALVVTATFDGSGAAVTTSIDATHLDGGWYSPGDRWEVTCNWIQTGGTWAMTTCDPAVAVTP